MENFGQSKKSLPEITLLSLGPVLSTVILIVSSILGVVILVNETSRLLTQLFGI